MAGWTGFVTLVNRVKRPLTITFDGQTQVVPPLGTLSVPPIVADRAVNQHPVMGTEDPYNPRSFESLLGVKEWPNSNCEPLERESEAIERIDRSMLPPDVQQTTVRKARGTVRPDRAVKSSGADIEVVFDGR